MRKNILKTFMAALTITTSMTMVSFAGQWQQDQIGWWWQEDNGSYPVSQWKEIGNEWYYFNSAGYMAENQWRGDYYLGADGAMLKDCWTPDGYYVGPDGKWVSSKQNSLDFDAIYAPIMQFGTAEQLSYGDVEYTVRDLNDDGIKELVEVDSIGWNVWAWTYQNGKVEEVSAPSNRYNGLNDKILYTTNGGNAYGSHIFFDSHAYYKLNSNNEFELLVALDSEYDYMTGADTYYVSYEDGERKKVNAETYNKEYDKYKSYSKVLY